ncbi:MAG: pentapeptide repeat-containing protein, partial [Nitrososphaeraceae archaeon]
MFKGDVDFSNATFGIFEKQVDFDSEADFTASAFLERADFSGAKFMKAHFVSSSFGEKAYFITTEFYSKANFKQAYFSGQATFFYTQLGDKPDFSDVLFENAQKVLFSVKELLHPTSFINTNITSVRFSKAVNWAEEKIDSSVDLEALKAVYRNLRENYENSFRFIDAQIYHIREMDLKRKDRGAGDIMKGIRPQPEKNGRIRRTFSLTGMYYLISRYGYDYVR